MEKEKKRETIEVDTGEEKVIPVIEEELKTGKRVIDTGVTRIRKIVREREEIVDIPLIRDQVEVKRVPVNRFIDAPVAERKENDTTIIPVFEEVMVTEKRLLLKEELHVTKRAKTVREPKRITLRNEEVIVERDRGGEGR
jgi:uncharacterized protein (TIGR02271 family)